MPTAAPPMPARAPRRTRHVVGAIAVAILAVALLSAACGGGSDGVAGGRDADLVHVHGIGVNPADGALYIAAHTGLFRMAEGSDDAERIGDRRQDTMGFTIAGSDRFLGSGHPDLREDHPPLLGLIESRDRGRSWRPVSLEGQADFHALRTTGSLVHGYDASGGRLMISSDGGRTWTERRSPPPLSDFVVDPDDPAHLVASAESGLVASRDEGRTWRPLPEPPGLLAWPRRDALYSVSFDGRVLRSENGGARWTRVGDMEGQPAALTAAGGDRLVVALEHGGLMNSSDGGRTWLEGAWGS